MVDIGYNVPGKYKEGSVTISGVYEEHGDVITISYQQQAVEWVQRMDKDSIPIFNEMGYPVLEPKVSSLREFTANFLKQ